MGSAARGKHRWIILTQDPSQNMSRHTNAYPEANPCRGRGAVRLVAMREKPQSSAPGAQKPAGNTVTTRASLNNAAPASHTGAVRATWPMYLFFFVLAGVVAAVISWGFLAQSLAALGIPDPGPLTTAGLPFLRAGALILCALATGSFLAAAFLISPRDPVAGDDEERLQALTRARLSVDGVLAARTGGWASLAVAAIAVLMVPMYLSDVSGSPLGEAIKPLHWGEALDQVSTSLAFIWVAIFAAIAGVGGLLTRTWIMQPVLLLVSLFTIVPLGLEGHSAAGGDHDYGTNSYLWHLIFMVLWVGGLMALVAHCRRKGPGMVLAVRRYSTVALVSIVAMAASGLINAVIRIKLGDWLTTGYGLLMTAKLVGVVVLAGFGWAHRAWAIPHLEKRPELFRRIAAVEIAVMAAITGVAVSLSRTPPPPPRSTDLNTMDIELGYKLSQAPTMWNVWTMWRFDVVFGTVAIVLTVLYAWGLVKLRRKNKQWPWQRTAWFMLGNFSLFITTCSGIGMTMPAMFSMHMVGHMILSMVVPVFWVLGGPLTLAKQALDPAPAEQPGLREWILALENNAFVRFITHPAINTIQFLVFFYGLYVEPLYTYAISEHAGHLGMNVLFLLSGTVYFWDLIGVDPVPRYTSPMARAWWLTFSLPVHMFFAVALMMTQTVLGGDFYRPLGLPWDIDLLHDQLVGGGIAWASGQFPLVIVYIVVVRQWYLADKKDAADYDSHADATDDEDLAAYNDYLGRLSRGEALPGSGQVTAGEARGDAALDEYNAMLARLNEQDPRRH